MAAVTAPTFGKRVCDAVGISPERCIGLTIEVQPDDFVRVVATYVLEDGQADEVVKLLTERAP